MGIIAGPSIVDDGSLIFHYDMENVTKSFKGAPTTNLYADGDFSTQTLHPVNNGPWSFVDGITDPNGNNVIRIDQDGTTSFHGRDITVSVGVTYSASCWCWVSPDCNSTRVSLYGEQGFEIGSDYNLGQKGTWQYLSSTRTATTTNARILAYQLSNMTQGHCLFGSVQFEQQSFATPFVNGTRSNTDNIVDLTGNETVTANSLTYNSDNTFTFSNGEYITLANSASIFGSGSVSTTLDFWIKPISVSGHIPVGHQNVSGERLYIGIYPNVPQVWDLGWGSFAWDAGFTGTRPSVDFNQWQHICVSINSGVVSLYKNGVKSTFSKTDTSVNLTGVFPIGTYFEVGAAPNAAYYGTDEIDIFRIYNRALTAAEIKQNYESQKGRFL